MVMQNGSRTIDEVNVCIELLIHPDHHPHEPRGPYVPVRSDFAESETLVESDGVGEVEVEVAAAMTVSIEAEISLDQTFLLDLFLVYFFFNFTTLSHNNTILIRFIISLI